MYWSRHAAVGSERSEPHCSTPSTRATVEALRIPPDALVLRLVVLCCPARGGGTVHPHHDDQGGIDMSDVDDVMLWYALNQLIADC